MSRTLLLLGGGRCSKAKTHRLSTGTLGEVVAFDSLCEPAV
jgi:hypothetical protein